MFYVAPILFCPPCNLADVSYQAIRIGTVKTIEAFQLIQVFQVTAIEDNVIRANHFRNSTDVAPVTAKSGPPGKSHQNGPKSLLGFLNSRGILRQGNFLRVLVVAQSKKDRLA
jgi:hypothetical protein